MGMGKCCASTEKLYWLLKFGRLTSEEGARACSDALTHLREVGVRDFYEGPRVLEIAWLAGALIMRKAIEPPVVPEHERACNCGEGACPAMPKLRHLRWYYPLNVLIDGVEHIYEEECAKLESV